MIPQAIVAVTVALTLKSDSEPVKINVNKPRGTVYWGGAGLEGDYISDQVAALQEAGIKHVWTGKVTYGQYPDAARATLDLRYKGRSDDRSWMLAGMEKVPANQFNLIGYSYGSLMAAQTAHMYATNGDIVDHLVLIGSTIDREFLADLKANKNIKNVIVVNLTEHGDPIYAGISQWRLMFAGRKITKQEEQSGELFGIGHFYFRPPTQQGKLRRRELASYLYRQGLR